MEFQGREFLGSFSSMTLFQKVLNMRKKSGRRSSKNTPTRTIYQVSGTRKRVSIKHLVYPNLWQNSEVLSCWHLDNRSRDRGRAEVLIGKREDARYAGVDKLSLGSPDGPRSQICLANKILLVVADLLHFQLTHCTMPHALNKSDIKDFAKKKLPLEYELFQIGNILEPNIVSFNLFQIFGLKGNCKT